MRFSKNSSIILILLMFVVVSTGFTAEQKVKSLRIDGNLTFDIWSHKLQPGWGVASSNLAKVYNQDQTSEDTWHYFGGQTLNMDISYRPSKNWTMMLGILAIGNYADRFYIPINDEHRLKDNNQKIKWTKGEIAYKGDRFQASLNGGLGHYHWEGEGDMFQLYPEQFDVYNYRRISGRQVPRGLDLKYTGDFGKLELVHGSELVWGDRTSTYGKYNWRWGYFNNAFIFKNARVSWGEKPKEKVNAYELTSRVDMFESVPIELGLLYQPFRLGREFTYIEESGENNLYTISNSTNTINTGSHQIKSGVTSTSDAIGYKTRFGFRFIPGIEEVSVGYAHIGASAGNKQEYSGGLKKEINAYTNLDFSGIYQKPIYGPLPYLYEGTAANPEQAVTKPRARTDAFWVTMDNRQAHIYKLTLNFDPTPSSWLYVWQPNILEEWNMNPKENSTFALAFQYLARKYPTTTDRWYYRNRDDDLLWEGESDPTKEYWDYRPCGKWATDWLHSFNTMIRLIPVPEYKLWMNLKWGQDIATGSLAYTLDTDENKPITSFFLGTVWLDKKPYKVSATYGNNVWGWEEWHQRFGGTNDRLYKFSLSKTWESAPFDSTDSTIGVEYVGIRETDNKYVYPELGSFDEWRLFFNLHFSSLVVFQKEEKPVVTKKKAIPPSASLTVLTPVFTPGTGDNPEAIFAIAASDSKGIKSWNISITDKNDNLVKTFSGKGQPPLEKEWDGIDMVTKETSPEGDYQVILKVTNKANRYIQTDPQTVTLQIPQIEIAKEVLAEVPVELKEEERGLVMNITSSVLFDFDKYKLKEEALEVLPDVNKLLQMYPKNKVMIEGHTDSIGSEEYNQKLSTRRATSVYNYFVKEGVDKTRMEKRGLGETKPIASNRTQAGRAQNRRVEVILLKDTSQEQGISIDQESPAEEDTVEEE